MPVAKPLDLPFDPIERAAEIWGDRFGPADAMAAVTSIMRAQQILLAGLDGLLRPYGLTFARYEALVLLAFSRHGALPAGPLAVGSPITKVPHRRQRHAWPSLAR